MSGAQPVPGSGGVSPKSASGGGINDGKLLSRVGVKKQESKWPEDLKDACGEALNAFVESDKMARAIAEILPAFTNEDGTMMEFAESPVDILDQLIIYGLMVPFSHERNVIDNIIVERFTSGRARERKGDDETIIFGVDDSPNVSRYSNLKISYINAPSLSTDMFPLMARVSFKQRPGKKSERYMIGYISIGISTPTAQSLCDHVAKKGGFRNVSMKTTPVMDESHQYMNAKLMQGETAENKTQVSFKVDGGIETATVKEFADDVKGADIHFMWSCHLCVQITAIAIVDKAKASVELDPADHDVIIDLRIKIINALKPCARTITGTDGAYLRAVSNNTNVKKIRAGIFR